MGSRVPFSGYDENGAWIVAEQDEHGNIVPAQATPDPRVREGHFDRFYIEDDPQATPDHAADS